MQRLGSSSGAALVLAASAPSRLPLSFTHGSYDSEWRMRQRMAEFGSRYNLGCWRDWLKAKNRTPRREAGGGGGLTQVTVAPGALGGHENVVGIPGEVPWRNEQQFTKISFLMFLFQSSICMGSFTEENRMRKILLAVSGAALVFAAGIATEPVNALTGPAGMSAAIEEMAMLDNVHCRPGRRHHIPTWRFRADGCRRPVRDRRPRR